MDNDIQAGAVLAVPPKCAVRDSVMDYLKEYFIGYILPSFARHKLPVTPSSTIASWSPAGAELSNVYRCGLVRLWRRIAVRINSAPSLNCVLVIATQ